MESLYALGAREPGLPAGLPTLPRTLQSAGYQTWLVGKWHLGTASPPLQSGFTHFYGFEGPEVDYFAHTNKRGEVDWQRNGQTVNETGYSTFLIANEAIRLIDQRDTKAPFFLQVAFNAPHFPLSAPESFLDKYKSLNKASALRSAVVDAFDEAVGSILRSIETQGLSENTLVIFISDNGADQTGRNIPFRGGKGSVYEGGIRLPCFMRLPGKIPPGTRSHQATAAQDLYPTIASAVRVSLDANKKMDGKDRWEALLDVNAPQRERFVIAGSDMAIFDGDWKLIQSMDGRLSLFNLNEDPHEQKDVLSQNVEVSERLKKTLAEMTVGFSNLSQRRGPTPRPRRPGR